MPSHLTCCLVHVFWTERPLMASSETASPGAASVDWHGILDFLRRAEQLKDTLRSGYTQEGRQESVAAHTWRLCLMAVLLQDRFPEVDGLRLIKMCLIHDLGEAIHGDIPAPDQSGTGDKATQEHRDFQTLIAPLPTHHQDEFMALWEEYEAATSPEAQLAKGLDKLETLLQHTQGNNPPDFDYRFNLEYGRAYTDAHPLLAEIRDAIDAETKRRAEESE